MFCFGKNEYSQCGGDLEVYSAFITELKPVEDLPPLKQISAGMEHSIFYTRNSKLLVRGNRYPFLPKKKEKNHEFGRNHYREILEDPEINQVCCLRDGTMILKEDGELIFNGKLDYKSLGYNRNKFNNGGSIGKFPEIVKIYGGGTFGVYENNREEFFLFGTLAGEVFVFQEPLKLASKDDRVRQVSCGLDHLVILKENNQLWGMGSNTLK